MGLSVQMEEGRGNVVTLLTSLTRVSVGGNSSSESQSPFLGVELERGLLMKLGLVVLGLHADPVRVVPQLVLLQTHLGGKHGLAVGAAVTQLLGDSGLMTTQT